MARRPIAQIPRYFLAGRPSRRLLAFGSGRNTGFALIAVIWSLGLITLLGLAFIVGARYRAKFSFDYVSAAEANLAAESAVNLAIASALGGSDGSKLDFPLSCRMPGGEAATITIDEENGKVDLNTATPSILAQFFTALTRDMSRGARIAARIVEFRDPSHTQSNAQSNSPSPSANPVPGFTTIMQLDGVGDLPAPLFRTALRFVTVRSGRAEPDLEAASPALRRLLGAEPTRQNAKRGLPIGGSVTIRADVTGPNGTRFIREALVSLGAENGRPFTIREWRHGDIGTAAPSPAQDRSRSFRRCIDLQSLSAG